MASAKGVRLEKSKLRGNLDIFTYGDFAVISSKDFWRLVDAQETISPKLNINSVGQVKVFTKAVNLLIRMIKGEEKNEELWNQAKSLFLSYFRPRRISLGRKGKPYKRRFERLGNKIHSGYFENSRLYGGSAGFRKGLDIGHK